MNRARFSGHQFEIPGELDDQTNYAVQFEAEVIEVRKKNNEDGTYTNIHVLRPILVALKPLDGKVYAEPVNTFTTKKSSSRRLRDHLYILWDMQYRQKYPDFQVYYEAYIDKIDKQIDKIKQLLDS